MTHATSVVRSVVPAPLSTNGACTPVVMVRFPDISALIAAFRATGAPIAAYPTQDVFGLGVAVKGAVVDTDVPGPVSRGRPV